MDWLDGPRVQVGATGHRLLFGVEALQIVPLASSVPLLVIPQEFGDDVHDIATTADAACT